MLISKLVPLAQPAIGLDIALLLLFIAKQQPSRNRIELLRGGKGSSCLANGFGVEMVQPEMLMNPPKGGD